MLWGSRRSPLPAAYPLRRQTVRLGGLAAGGLRPQAGAAGDAAPQPGKRIPAAAARWQVWR